MDEASAGEVRGEIAIFSEQGSHWGNRRLKLKGDLEDASVDILDNGVAGARHFTQQVAAFSDYSFSVDEYTLQGFDDGYRLLVMQPRCLTRRSKAAWEGRSNRACTVVCMSASYYVEWNVLRLRRRG